MIPAVQLILAIASSLFGAKLLGLLGIQPPAQDDGTTTGRVYVLPDHPAAKAASSIPATPAPGTTTPAPGTTTPPKEPGVKTLVSKALDNGWVTWGVAAVLFGAPLFISQTRAAFADVRDAGGSVYNEARAGYRRVDNADDYTGLDKHRRRGRR